MENQPCYWCEEQATYSSKRDGMDFCPAHAVEYDALPTEHEGASVPGEGN